MWVLCEEEIDIVAERLLHGRRRARLTAEQKEDVARVFRKGVECLMDDWDVQLRLAVEEVVERRDVRRVECPPNRMWAAQPAPKTDEVNNHEQNKRTERE